MMRERFTITTTTATITPSDDDVDGPDVSHEALGEDPATLREALDALAGGCWDHVEVRLDHLTAYPADYAVDPWTGEGSADTVRIAGEPDAVRRLHALYRATRKGES